MHSSTARGFTRGLTQLMQGAEFKTDGLCSAYFCFEAPRLETFIVSRVETHRATVLAIRTSPPFWDYLRIVRDAYLRIRAGSGLRLCTVFKSIYLLKVGKYVVIKFFHSITVRVDSVLVRCKVEVCTLPSGIRTRFVSLN